ncbi:MAG: hypothetical protein ABI192_03865 [Bradyrhizobium sp.]
MELILFQMIGSAQVRMENKGDQIVEPPSRREQVCSAERLCRCWSRVACLPLQSGR